MASFPSIRPAARKYGVGMFPITAQTGFGGGNVRFRHGSDRRGVTLELEYVFITDAEAQLLRDHYRGQDGSHRSFLLPAIIWAGQSSPGNILATNTPWKYASELEEQHRSGGLFDVTVKLVSVS
jgi:hypothetical protein